MSSVSPGMFGLHDAVLELSLDLAWRALVRRQVHTLTGMLQRIQTAVAGFHRRIDVLRLSTLAADAEQFLAAQALQHVRLEREQGQLRALATILALFNKAQQAEDILEPEEPRHRRQDDAYDRDGIAIGEEIGVHTQRYARKQWHDLALLFAIDEVPSTDGAEEDGQHQDRSNIHWSLLEMVVTHGLRYRLRERHRNLWLRPPGHPACPGKGGDARTA
jgi:hypothetical protein